MLIKELNENGNNAFFQAYKHFPHEEFSAADLSAKAGIKFYAQTLNSIVNLGYMVKNTDVSPILYRFIDEIDVLVAALQTMSDNAGCDNTNLVQAKKNKDDEFYTQLDYVNSEVVHYQRQFRNKSIFLNCNDGPNSAFWEFFAANFSVWGLKRLVAISYEPEGHGQVYILDADQDLNQDGYIDGADMVTYALEGDGSFSSDESIKFLQECDIVCTNPPFSEFRNYIALLLKYQKQFLIIGSQNAVGYKDVFPLIQNNELWVGYNSGDMKFKVPADSPEKAVRFWIDETGQKWRSLGNICWYTNITTTRRTEPLFLTATYYDPLDRRETYEKYDNYDAINVDRYANIPSDYYEPMGVPITFIAKYCPLQFKIIDKISPVLNGANKYTRIVIQRVK